GRPPAARPASSGATAGSPRRLRRFSMVFSCATVTTFSCVACPFPIGLNQPGRDKRGRFKGLGHGRRQNRPPDVLHLNGAQAAGFRNRPCKAALGAEGTTTRRREMLKPLIAVASAGLLAAACTTTGNVERNAAGGAALGALAGAVIGNN